MALRVLLADESNTIKRVIELSLQDYAVEVRPVHIGTDVLQIAKAYRPDIIFVDILLQKLSGYEVSRLVKSDPQLQRTPVILMWSGFMDFDEQKFKSSGADAKLEKPFNSDTLRNLVQNAVAKTKTQNLSQFIKLPEFVEEPTPLVPPKTTLPPQAKKGPAPIHIDNVEALEIDTGTISKAQPSWNMESFENIESFAQKMRQTPNEQPEDFAQVRLNKKPSQTPQPPSGFSPADYPSADSWIQQDINKFRAPEPVDEEKTLMDSLQGHEEDAFEFTQPQRPSNTGKHKKLVLEEITPTPKPISHQNPSYSQSPSIDEEKLAAQTKEIIEQVIWKVVPEIAEKLIREELERLLKAKDGEIGIE